MRKISIEILLNTAENFNPEDQAQVELVQNEQVALEALLDSIQRISTEGVELNDYDRVVASLISRKKNLSVEELRTSSEAIHPVLGALLIGLVYVLAYVLGYMFGTWLYKKIKGSGKGRVSSSLDGLSDTKTF